MVSQVLVVGGPPDFVHGMFEKRLNDVGIQIVSHTSEFRGAATPYNGISNKCDGVLILTDFGGHCLEERVKREAKGRGLPVALITRKWSYAQQVLRRLKFIPDNTEEKEEAMRNGKKVAEYHRAVQTRMALRWQREGKIMSLKEVTEALRGSYQGMSLGFREYAKFKEAAQRLPVESVLNKEKPMPADDVATSAVTAKSGIPPPVFDDVLVGFDEGILPISPPSVQAPAAPVPSLASTFGGEESSVVEESSVLELMEEEICSNPLYLRDVAGLVKKVGEAAKEPGVEAIPAMQCTVLAQRMITEFKRWLMAEKKDSAGLRRVVIFQRAIAGLCEEAWDKKERINTPIINERTVALLGRTVPLGLIGVTMREMAKAREKEGLFFNNIGHKRGQTINSTVEKLLARLRNLTPEEANVLSMMPKPKSKPVLEVAAPVPVTPEPTPVVKPVMGVAEAVMGVVEAVMGEPVAEPEPVPVSVEPRKPVQLGFDGVAALPAKEAKKVVADPTLTALFTALINLMGDIKAELKVNNKILTDTLDTRLQRLEEAVEKQARRKFTLRCEGDE